MRNPLGNFGCTLPQSICVDMYDSHLDSTLDTLRSLNFHLLGRYPKPVEPEPDQESEPEQEANQPPELEYEEPSADDLAELYTLRTSLHMYSTFNFLSYRFDRSSLNSVFTLRF